MAAGLFLELRAFCEAARKRGQQVPEYEVGVVTPYRQQKACLRETFERMAGPAATSKVPPCFQDYFVKYSQLRPTESLISETFLHIPGSVAISQMHYLS